MAKNTGKVREFCQFRKVSTLVDLELNWDKELHWWLRLLERQQK